MTLEQSIIDLVRDLGVERVRIEFEVEPTMNGPVLLVGDVDVVMIDRDQYDDEGVRSVMGVTTIARIRERGVGADPLDVLDTLYEHLDRRRRREWLASLPTPGFHPS